MKKIIKKRIPKGAWPKKVPKPIKSKERVLKISPKLYPFLYAGEPSLSIIRRFNQMVRTRAITEHEYHTILKNKTSPRIIEEFVWEVVKGADISKAKGILFKQRKNIQKRAKEYLYAAPIGQFFKRMERLDRDYHGVPVKVKAQWIEKRLGWVARTSGRPEYKGLKREWKDLCKRRGVLSRVLFGEDGGKFTLAGGIPSSNKEIRVELKKVNRRIKEIEKSL